MDYWNTAALTPFHIVCGYFHATMAELSICDRDHVAHKAENIPSGPSQKRFSGPWFRYNCTDSYITHTTHNIPTVTTISNNYSLLMHQPHYYPGDPSKPILKPMHTRAMHHKKIKSELYHMHRGPDLAPQPYFCPVLTAHHPPYTLISSVVLCSYLVSGSLCTPGPPHHS